MADSKTIRELATEVTIAWIKARADVTAANGGPTAERSVPNQAEVAQFYKFVHEAIRST
ncbi:MULTISPECIES: hypothetical protein [Paenibacillus]|uniref:hypothetical protein n=1 Tax=Paenibacillus TaxID=44249 RepID=UPI0022B8F66D|nr:hypothetical protein [Paenibacillus caseinilyticus]MCZ8520141.1 hypothetical protein [Paenibacillus caseinilyticus]